VAPGAGFEFRTAKIVRCDLHDVVSWLP
jgi:hypothetical protein